MNQLTKHLFGIFEGQEVAIYRILRGPYSQIELGEILGVDSSAVFRWETAQVTPQPEHLRALLIHAVQWTKQLDLKLPDLLDEHSRRRRDPKPVDYKIGGTP